MNDISREEFLEQLPPGTHEYSYRGTEDMVELIEQAIRNENNRSQYMIFSNVPGEVFNRETPDGRPISKQIKCYHRRLKILTIKMPSEPQERAASSVETLLAFKVAAMGLRRQLLSLRQPTVHGSQRSKQPDSSFRPRDLPTRRTDHWPSVVVEFGYSESGKKVDEDNKWWLNESQGGVRLAISIKIHRGQHRKIDVQRWELGPIDGTRRIAGRTGPKVVERVGITARQGAGNQLSFDVNGAPMTVPFQHVFLRPPSNPAEGDITFTTADFQEIAESAW